MKTFLGKEALLLQENI